MNQSFHTSTKMPLICRVSLRPQDRWGQEKGKTTTVNKNESFSDWRSYLYVDKTGMNLARTTEALHWRMPMLCTVVFQLLISTCPHWEPCVIRYLRSTQLQLRFNTISHLISDSHLQGTISLVKGLWRFLFIQVTCIPRACSVASGRAHSFWTFYCSWFQEL